MMLGCSAESKEELNRKRIQKKTSRDLKGVYNRDLSFFDIKYVKHFPKTIDNTYIQHLNALSPDVGEISLFLEKKIDKNEYNEIVKYYSSISKKILSTTDSLLVVNRFSSMERYYKVKLTTEEKRIINESSSYSYPVPTFWTSNFTSKNTTCKLSRNFTIYIIEAEKGRFLEDKYLTNGEYMPDEWSNGFSRGIAISENDMTIIYWVVIW